MPLLGDLIARVTSAVGVKPCAPCKQRQAALNRWQAQHTGRTALIQQIQCHTCKNYAWTSDMHPTLDMMGRPHHPACPVIRSTYVLDVRT